MSNPDSNPPGRASSEEPGESATNLGNPSNIDGLPQHAASVTDYVSEHKEKVLDDNSESLDSPEDEVEAVGDEIPQGGKSSTKAANKKKTKGRIRIEIKYIQDKVKRNTTFSKRKSGLLKKAVELGTLSGAKVAVIVFSENGNLYQQCSPGLPPLLPSELGKQLVQRCLHGEQINQISSLGEVEANTAYDVQSPGGGTSEVPTSLHPEMIGSGGGGNRSMGAASLTGYHESSSSLYPKRIDSFGNEVGLAEASWVQPGAHANYLPTTPGIGQIPSRSTQGQVRSTQGQVPSSTQLGAYSHMDTNSQASGPYQLTNQLYYTGTPAGRNMPEHLGGGMVNQYQLNSNVSAVNQIPNALLPQRFLPKPGPLQHITPHSIWMSSNRTQPVQTAMNLQFVTPVGRPVDVSQKAMQPAMQAPIAPMVSPVLQQMVIQPQYPSSSPAVPPFTVHSGPAPMAMPIFTPLAAAATPRAPATIPRAVTATAQEVPSTSQAVQIQPPTTLSGAALSGPESVDQSQGGAPVLGGGSAPMS